MIILSKNIVKIRLSQIEPENSAIKTAKNIIALSGQDNRFKVLDIHKAVFSHCAPASANSNLNRTITAVNRLAEDCGISLQMKITGDKKLGAAGRWVWFEGCSPLPISISTTGNILGDRVLIGRKLKNEQGGVVDAMPYIEAWLMNAQAPPLFVLLGDCGIGKTHVCQNLVAELNERRKQDIAGLTPLYIDLRHVTGLDRRVPTLTEILEECMARGWQLQKDGDSYTIAHFYQWLNQGAIVIFDGLDQALTQLSEREARIFTNELLRLQSEVRERGKNNGTPCSVKMLIVCRSEYFRNLLNQKSYFTGEEYENGLTAALMPLNEEQVERYVATAISKADFSDVMSVVCSTYNLRELLQHPYLLHCVSQYLQCVTAQSKAGQALSGVQWYRYLAQCWLNWGQGRHQIRADHKLLLTECLAAYMWREGHSQLAVGEIEDWFQECMYNQPALTARYARLPQEQLENDLRTATFLVRREAGENSYFCFAHASLAEYFLACYLLRALRDNAPERWAMPIPSGETLDFLEQLLAEKEGGQCRETLRRWQDDQHSAAIELLRTYVGHARHRG